MIMPNLDKTGPLGEGLLTGRKRGFCHDKQTEKSENNPQENRETRYGFGFKRGFLRGNQGKGQRGRNRGSGRGFARKNI